VINQIGKSNKQETEAYKSSGSASNFVTYLFVMSDQCALDESGNLKEAKDIEFFYSEGETTPLPSSATSSQRNPGNVGGPNTLLSLEF
jgi:hypothetical protein